MYISAPVNFDYYVKYVTFLQCSSFFIN